MKPSRDIKGLLNICRKSNATYEQEQEVVKALTDLGDNAIDWLIASLEETVDEPIRWDAWALGKIGNTRAVEPLIRALNKGDLALASSAAEALGEIGDTRAVLPLIEILKSNYEPLRGTLRYNAVEALGEIGDTRAVETLIKILNDNKDYYIGRLAAQALGKIGDNRAVDSLINTLYEDNIALQHDVAEALAEIGEVEAVIHLAKTLKKRTNSYSKENYIVNSEELTIGAIIASLEKIGYSSEKRVDVKNLIYKAKQVLKSHQ
jgi:HEAT repeat protein